MPVPLAHIVTAVLLRLRGVPVALSSMGMLGENFTRSTWSRGRRTAFAWVTDGGRGAPHPCRDLARRFVCLSVAEARLAHLPRARCAVVPWPAPPTRLGRAGQEPRNELVAPRHPGPIAAVTRLDVQRKGLDRLAAWLRACADELPRPAALLLAPDGVAGVALLGELEEEGLLVWDRTTTGSEVLDRPRPCRGLLPSRWEAQARAVREAALLGLPTVSTETGGAREVQAALGTGAIVDEDDPRDVR